MSKNYNTQLQTHNTGLQEILDEINSLPNAGGEQATPIISVNSTTGLITATAGTKAATKQLNTQSAKTITPSTSKQTAVAKDVYTTGVIEVAAMPTATQATPSISVNSSGLITASATQTAGYISAGTKSATKQLNTKGATTITPSSTEQIAVSAGTYVTGNIVVSASSSGSSSGGGSSTSLPSASKKQVNFYDYDGTILYSYTIAEAQALTALPALPSHDGLICQGWNYDLATIKSYNRAVDVGAMYITDDGKTRIYIHLEEGRTSPMLGCCPAGTVTVDWGDGTATSTLTGLDNYTVRFTNRHNYANPGNYVITLTVDGLVGFDTQSTAHFSALLVDTSEPGTSNVRSYSNAIQKIEIGNNVSKIGGAAFYKCYSLSSITIPNNSITSIGGSAFSHCYSLHSITIPKSVTSIGAYAFSDCTSLSSISIPDGVTSIETSPFNYCYSLSSLSIPNGVSIIPYQLCLHCTSLSSISIPDGVTLIDASAFSHCYCLSYIVIPSSVSRIADNAFDGCLSVSVYDFTSHTSVPTLSNINAFDSTSAIIRIPSSLADSWTTATNWTNYTSRMEDENGNKLGESGGYEEW